MKKFIFRLESVLSLKRSIEQQTKNEMAQIETEIHKIKNDIIIVKKEFQKKNEELRKRLKEGENATVIFNFSTYFSALKEKRNSLEHTLIYTERKREEIRKRLFKVVTERKTVEKLREKQYSEYLYDLNIEQAKEVDNYLSSRLAGEL